MPCHFSVVAFAASLRSVAVYSSFPGLSCLADNHCAQVELLVGWCVFIEAVENSPTGRRNGLSIRAMQKPRK